MFEANKAVELFNLRKSQLKKQISDCRKKEFWNKASPRWDATVKSTAPSRPINLDEETSIQITEEDWKLSKFDISRSYVFGIG